MPEVSCSEDPLNFANREQDIDIDFDTDTYPMRIWNDDNTFPVSISEGGSIGNNEVFILVLRGEVNDNIQSDMLDVSESVSSSPHPNQWIGIKYFKGEDLPL